MYQWTALSSEQQLVLDSTNAAKRAAARTVLAEVAVDGEIPDVAQVALDLQHPVHNTQ